MPPIGNIITTGFWPAVYLLIVAVGPLILFAAAVHLLERIIQQRLVTRFGWRSVLWTGWLGAPIHELSHAVVCVIFRHRIEEIALFEPDLQSGRLGYVRHAYRAGNWYQEIGNVFIGIAPLAGGTLALVTLLMLFYPEAGRAALLVDLGGNGRSFWAMVLDSTQALVVGLFQWQHLASLRFWLFVYLILCVGSHMAPSLSDYHGGLKGSLFLIALLLGVSLFVSLFNSPSTTITVYVAPVLVPVMTVLMLVLVLCGIATGLVFLVTGIFDKLRIGK